MPAPQKKSYKLITLFGIILAFGLIMLTSASQVVGFDTYQDSYWYLKHQLFFGILPGLAGFFVCSKIKYTFWKRLAIPFYILSIILLILVFVPQLNLAHGGADRWIDLKFFSMQPSEFAKLTTVIFFSTWIAKKKEHIGDFYFTFLPFLGLLGMSSLLIALQPDIGTLTVIIAIALGIYFVGGITFPHLAGMILTGAVVFSVLVYAAPYRVARIATFLNKDVDKLGTSYQLNQSLLGIGSGGIWGLGLGQSKQKYQYLPEVIGDSIFAIIAEELGFIFTSAFILLYLYFIFTGFHTGLHAKDAFGKYMAVGISTWLGYQALVNISAMIGILPLTGLPLPFVSYGSSALIPAMAAVGILHNISKYRTL